MEPVLLILATAAIFLVALLYSSVGHGGASGYLAVLSFCALSQSAMVSNALILNLLVAGIAFLAFYKAGYFSWTLIWPFALTSIPAAFLGGMLEVPRAVYSILLILVFAFAAFRLWFFNAGERDLSDKQPHAGAAALIGSLLGLLSGIVGVGGGIFLSPLLLFLKWAGPKKTAAASAFFIWVNSFSGLMGRSFSGQFETSPALLVMIAAAFTGSLIGSGLGASVFSSLMNRKTLAFVLLIATVKLMMTTV